MVTLGYLKTHKAPVVSLLMTQGLTAEAADEKYALYIAAAGQLAAMGHDDDTKCYCYWVPGRIEVVGKHTDYAGGRSLLCAISKGFACISVDNDDGVVNVVSEFAGAEHKAALKVSPELEPDPHHWSNYPATVIRRLARNFGIQHGCDLAIHCDLPKSSGMSSSSAMVCAMWLVLSERNKITESAKFRERLSTAEELYSYLGFIENGQNAPGLPGDKGVGTFGGSEDHTAIMSGRRGKLKMFSYCPTEYLGEFAFPPELTFVVAVSGADAEKTGNAMADYNNAAFLAFDAAKAWVQAATEAGEELPAPWNGRALNLSEIVAHVAQQLEVPAKHPLVMKAVLDRIDTLDDGAHFGPPKVEGKDQVYYAAGSLRRRFTQFFFESECIIADTAEAFAAANTRKLAALVDWSHQLTVSHLRNTIPATEFLPESARKLGAIAASAFGAGFGGSCWALVPCDGADAFTTAWRAAYAEAMPKWSARANFFRMTPCEGAFHLHL